ncbi:MAG: 4Fe-4S dicluster domain-containing protein [Bacillota bacterium]
MSDNGVSSGRIRYDNSFAEEIYALENGHYIKLCMQCGMCAVSCATRENMDYSPRRLFQLLRMDKKEEFINSNTMWMCSTCLMCKVRCPRGIPLVDVMHDLKCYAIKNGLAEQPPQAAFYQAFWQEVYNRGHMFMGGLMARYYLKRGVSETIRKGLEMRELGMSMVKHSRIPIKPPKTIKGIKDVRKIVEVAQAQMQKGEK